MKTLFYTCPSCGAEWTGSKKDSICRSCGSRSQRPVVSRHPPPILLQDIGARYLSGKGNPSPGKQDVA